MDFFAFKKFRLDQWAEVFKVTTDSILLGSWCHGTAGRVLDVGTGTGILALMIAQRNPSAQITGIDICEKAVELAYRNGMHSPWASRLTFTHASLEQFIANSDGKWDHIVCNPPFFDKVTLPISPGKSRSRHMTSLNQLQLLNSAVDFLTDDGILSLIIPYAKSEDLMAIARIVSLHCFRRTNVITKPGNRPKRILLEFSKKHFKCRETTLPVYDQYHKYSEEYQKLTADFYQPMKREKAPK